jgi:serine/threonine protein phosphatase PrpC
MAKNYFGITDVGSQRKNNEDAFIAAPVLKDQYIAVGVIDGVGGYEGGEIAAAIAQQSILGYLQIPSGEVLTMMREAMTSANEKIYQEKGKNEQLNSMACVATLALVDIKQNKFYYAHVGDTRLYLLRDKTLVKVTKDHSFVGYLEDTGRLTEQAAMQHPKRNEINKALGFEAPLPNVNEYIETGESPFLPGDSLLLCSDGLTDMVDSQLITSVLNNSDTLEGKCQTLVDAANKAGGKDNITVVIVQHTAKPVKQAATKPVAPVKKNENPLTEQQVQPLSRGASRVYIKESSSSKLPIALSLLCLLLLGGLIWSLFFRNRNDQQASIVDPPIVAAVQEQRLLAALERMTGDTLLLNDSLASPIYLTNTLLLQKDTLVLKGSGGAMLARDSSFRNDGSVSIRIAPEVKYILFDGLFFQDMVIATDNPYALHFKNVRFRNSYIQVKQGVRFSDSLFTGSVIDMQKATKDSLSKN